MCYNENEAKGAKREIEKMMNDENELGSDLHISQY